MSILNLRKQNARGAYPSNLDWMNKRRQQYGFIDFANRSNLITAQIAGMIEGSWGRPGVKIPVMSNTLPTVTSGAMDCTFSDVEATAALVDVTFASAYVPVSMVPREHFSNDLAYETVFMQMIADAEHALALHLEAAIVSAIDGAKATTANSGFVGVGKRYPLASDALQVSNTLSQTFFNDAKAVFQADNFDPSQLEVIGDAQLMSYVQHYINQGAGNDENLAYQFAGYNFGFSNSTVTSGGTTVSTGYIMPQNSIALVGRNNPDALASRETTTGKQYSTFASTLMGIDLDVMYMSDCSDESTRTGNALDTNAVKEQWKLGYNVAILTPYDLSTNTGIKKFDILA